MEESKENIKRQVFSGMNKDVLEANVNKRIEELGAKFISQQFISTYPNYVITVEYYAD